MCEKYHLPTLQYNPERKGVDYGEWKKKSASHQNEETKYTWNDIIRDDIDEAIQHSESFEAFLQCLKKMEYEIRNGKYLSLKPPGRQRPIRSGRLGNGYSKEDIQQRIENKKYETQINQRFKTYGNREELNEIIFLKIKRSPGWKMTPFQRQFYKRWNNTYFIRKPGRSQNWKYKKDILEIQKLSDCIKYMVDHDINSPDDLKQRRDIVYGELEALKKNLEVMRTRYYKTQPNYLVSQYDKLEKEFMKTGDAESKNKMEVIRKQIEKICPFEEAAERRNKMKLEIAEYRKLMRDSKRELKRIDAIFQFYYGEPDLAKFNINADEGKYKFEQEKFGEDNAMDREDAYTRVTINQKMFQNSPYPEFYVTRIPYQKNLFVKIPKEDSYMYESNEILSVYLYDHKEYELQDESGNTVHTIQGSDLKQYYEDKTRNRSNKKSKRGGHEL